MRSDAAEPLHSVPDPAAYKHGNPAVLEGGDLDVVIVGAGLQGMLAARRLTEEGLKVVVLERQASVGGIWASHANATSRAQNHEPAYRMGYTPAEEDYTHRDGIIEELRRGAVEAGVADRILCGIEVVRVAEESSCVRIFFHRLAVQGLAAAGQPPAQLEEICAGEVLFCTGTLQKPRQIQLQGEEVFGGPIVYGLKSAAERLDLRGKRVVVMGMGAFAIENARTALFAGASHVTMLVRHKLAVMTRFARVLAILQFNDYSSTRDRASRPHQPPYPISPSKLIMPPYIATGAQSSMPSKWQRAIKAGRAPDVWQSDSPTNNSTSDIFFLGHALRRLQVEVGEVSHLEPGIVVVHQGKLGHKSLEADVIIKNFGFENPDESDLLGGICEVTGHKMCRPPMWITPRISTFRHCTEVAPLAPHEWVHSDELFNFVGSGTFASSAYLEIYLHYRQRPELLRRLLSDSELPAKLISETTKLDMSRGLHVAMSFDESVRQKVNARRRAINEETWRRYAPPGTPVSVLHKAWVEGFLRENRADWEDACQRLTGDPHAVPYIWNSVQADRCAAPAAPPSIQAAL